MDVIGGVESYYRERIDVEIMCPECKSDRIRRSQRIGSSDVFLCVDCNIVFEVKKINIESEKVN